MSRSEQKAWNESSQPRNQDQSQNNVRMKTIAQLVETVENYQRCISDPTCMYQMLNYIQTNLRQLTDLPTHKQSHFTKLCGLLMNLIIDSSDSKTVTFCNTFLSSLIRTNYNDLDFLQNILKMEMKKRLPLLVFLGNATEDDIVIIVSKDDFLKEFIKDCLQSINVEKMPWLLKKEAKNLRMLNSEESEAVRKIDLEDQIVHQIIAFLTKIYSMEQISSAFCLKRGKLDECLMSEVVLLAYMGHKKQREAAMKLLKQALESGELDEVEATFPLAWDSYQKACKDFFWIRTKVLLSVSDPDWVDQFVLTMHLFGEKFCTDTVLVAHYTPIAFQAFNSENLQVQRGALMMWKIFIDYMVKNPLVLAKPKWMNILLNPLDNDHSTCEMITKTKIDVWWHFIVVLNKDLQRFQTRVVNNFLKFCLEILKNERVECFENSKLQMITDALMQLVVNEPVNDITTINLGVLSDRFSGRIDGQVFQGTYRDIIDCMMDIMSSIQNVRDCDERDNKIVQRLFWASLFEYTDECLDDCKFKILGYIVAAVAKSFKNVSEKSLLKKIFIDDEILKNFLIIAKSSSSFNGSVFPLINLLIDVMQKKKDESHEEALKYLLTLMTTSKDDDLYSFQTVPILLGLIQKLQHFVLEEKDCSFLLTIWCAIAKFTIEYLKNDGLAFIVNSMKLIVDFPFTCVVFPTNNTVIKAMVEYANAVKLWGELFKEYCERRNRMLHKTNVAFEEAVVTLQEDLKNCPHCVEFMGLCMNALISVVNFKTVLEQPGVHSVANLFNTIVLILTNKRSYSALRIALKATTKLLQGVFAEDEKKVWSYLQVLKPSIQAAIYNKEVEHIEKEMNHLWNVFLEICKAMKKLNHDTLTFCNEIHHALFHKSTYIPKATNALMQENRVISVNDFYENLDEETNKMEILFVADESLEQNQRNHLNRTSRKRRINDETEQETGAKKKEEAEVQILKAGTSSSGKSPTSFSEESYVILEYYPKKFLKLNIKEELIDLESMVEETSVETLPVVEIEEGTIETVPVVGVEEGSVETVPVVKIEERTIGMVPVVEVEEGPVKIEEESVETVPVIKIEERTIGTVPVVELEEEPVETIMMVETEDVEGPAVMVPMIEFKVGTIEIITITEEELVNTSLTTKEEIIDISMDEDS